MIDISYKFINLYDGDYHMHTSNFSDGLNSIQEMVVGAGEAGLTEIAITDHSQACLDRFAKNCRIYCGWARWSLPVWRNTHNDVKVIWWVEWDVLNEAGDTCFHIQGMEPAFIILSAHINQYIWDLETITDATCRAIERYHEKIQFVWHPCNNNDFGQYYDIEKLCDVANAYNIPLEVNAKNLLRWKTNLDKLHIMLKKADRLYLNSDAHGLYELKEAKPFARKWLREQWYIGKDKANDNK